MHHSHPRTLLPLLAQHLDERRNTNTAADVDSPWLFPGYPRPQRRDRLGHLRLLPQRVDEDVTESNHWAACGVSRT